MPEFFDAIAESARQEASTFANQPTDGKSRQEALLFKRKGEEELKGLKQDREERKRYATRIFNLIAVWLFGIFFLLILAGFRPFGFHLGDTVLVSFIGGTTINVLGIFIVVAKYLFPSRNGS